MGQSGDGAVEDAVKRSMVVGAWRWGRVAFSGKANGETRVLDWVVG